MNTKTNLPKNFGFAISIFKPTQPEKVAPPPPSKPKLRIAIRLPDSDPIMQLDREGQIAAFKKLGFTRFVSKSDLQYMTKWPLVSKSTKGVPL